MDRIYIALVDTPGLFASLIRRAIDLSYVHVALSLDEQLEEAYSVGRRNPFIPLLAGFEREDKRKIWKAFPTARYQIYSLPCETWQKAGIARQLRECYENRYSYHYCVAGLPFILFGKAFYQKNHYTCSSFIARCLEENGMALFKKHFSTVTPRDFYELEGKEILFEGELKDLVSGPVPPLRRGVLYES